METIQYPKDCEDKNFAEISYYVCSSVKIYGE